jgi:hypothetical protein
MRFLACIICLVGFASFAQAAEPDPEHGAIAGSVVGTDGVGLPEMSVKLYYAKDPAKKIAFADGPGPKAPPGLDAVAETKTDKDGKFKFDNVTPGEYMIITGDIIKGLGRSPASVKAGKTVEVKLTVRKRRVA